MPKPKELPSFAGKRKMLFSGKTPAEQMLQVGRRFVEAERYDDALEFFARTEAQDEVRGIVQLAINRGDAGLLLRAKVVLKEQPTEQELTTVARNAEAAGMNSMALTAHQKAGHEEEVDRLRDQMGIVPPPATVNPQEEGRS